MGAFGDNLKILMKEKGLTLDSDPVASETIVSVIDGMKLMLEIAKKRNKEPIDCSIPN